MEAGLLSAHSAIKVQREWVEKTTPENVHEHTRCFLSSLPPDEDIRLGWAVRNHWSVEINEPPASPRVSDLVILTWDTLPEKHYTVWASTDLTPESWVMVDGQFMGTGAPQGACLELDDDFEGKPQHQFWRVKVDDPQIDSDGDGLTNFEELLLGTSRYFSDTFGNGMSDLDLYLSGHLPVAGFPGSEEPTPGEPKGAEPDLYSIIFEVEHESRSIPKSIGYLPFNGPQDDHRYLTHEDIHPYAISNSPRYQDIANGEIRHIFTYLENGILTADGDLLSNTVGVSYEDWIAANPITLPQGRTLSWIGNEVTNVNQTQNGPAVLETTTITTRDWEIKEGQQVVDSGTETITRIHRQERKDRHTWAELWNAQIGHREWQAHGQPLVHEPLDWTVDYNRGVFGDAVAADAVREYYRQKPKISGIISSPGLLPSWDKGSDTRIKSMRWRWVRFDPHAPFHYIYEAPPPEYQKVVPLLITDRNLLSEWNGAGNTTNLTDTTTPVAIVNLTFDGGLQGWQEISPGQFTTYQRSAPANSENINFSNEAFTNTSFGTVPFEIIPSDGVTEASADDAEIIVVMRIGDSISHANGMPSFENSIVEWQIDSGNGGWLSDITTTVQDGLSAVTLHTSTSAGEIYVVKVRIKSVGGEGEFGGGDSWIHSTEITVVPGQPHSIKLTKSKNGYLSDGTDTIEVEAEIKDEAGNYVADGTSITWAVDQSPTPPFESIEVDTADGKAQAVVVSPLIPENQKVIATAGEATQETTITVERVTGSISGSINLDVGGQTPSTSTITATVDAIDGTPVFWLTSNGEITEESTVSGGSATATLSTQGGRLGTVLVTATVGDRLLIHEGAFVSNNGFAIGADYPVIVGDATSNGSEIVNYDHGLAREIPHFASTPVRLRGPANQVVNVSVQGSLPVAEWVFSSASNGVVESVTGNHPLTLVGSGATIFQNVGITGQGSLALDGNSHATVEADTELDFTSEFTATLRVLAGSHQASTLISKPGSWKIEMLGDGKVRAVVETDQGTYSATSSSPLAINTWSEIELDFRFNGLTLSVNQVLVAGDGHQWNAQRQQPGLQHRQWL